MWIFKSINHKMVCQSAVFPVKIEQENVIVDKWSVREEAGFLLMLKVKGIEFKGEA